MNAATPVCTFSIVGFGLIVSFVRSLLQQYWQSNTMIKVLGVGNKENQELFSQMFQLKGEYSWYFDFPILELIIMAVLLCTFDRTSKTKNIITGGGYGKLEDEKIEFEILKEKFPEFQLIFCSLGYYHQEENTILTAHVKII